MRSTLPRVVRFEASAACTAAAAAIMMLVTAAPVLAHVQEGQGQGFLTGLRHPVSGLDHVLAMIAVGMLGLKIGGVALHGAAPAVL